MLRTSWFPTGALSFALALLSAAPSIAQMQVKTANGLLEGVLNPATQVTSFKGIPFAAPPVGDLRWQAPQPPANWQGVRKADHFGPRAMQPPIFGDMNFRSNGMSEDCLYLNVWTPAKAGAARLPVLVYFYGGGFVAGDGSEYRYDGESLAARGIVTVTVNYRLGLFGFLALPELSAESPHHASGNYGLLDQQAALAWVRRNIAAFGGDPEHVTIGGESAGSISVSAQMASPLSKGLFQAAIGESGSIIGAFSAVPLAEGEATGVKIATGLGNGRTLTLAQLRAMPAEQLMDAAGKVGGLWLRPTIDGYFLPDDPRKLFAEGAQARVPLLAGVNSQESGPEGLLQGAAPTLANYRAALEKRFGARAGEAFKLYPAASDADVLDAAQALAGDLWIAHSTWTWADLSLRTGGQPVYYYLYAHPRPAMRPEMGDAVAGLAGGVLRNARKGQPPAPPARGAVHSAEIEYALGNLATNTVYAWTPDDHKVSETMEAYFANFIRSYNPNGPGLVAWPQLKDGQRLVIDVTCRAEDAALLRARGDFLDSTDQSR